MARFPVIRGHGVIARGVACGIVVCGVNFHVATLLCDFARHAFQSFTLFGTVRDAVQNAARDAVRDVARETVRFVAMVTHPVKQQKTSTRRSSRRFRSMLTMAGKMSSMEHMLKTTSTAAWREKNASVKRLGSERERETDREKREREDRQKRERRERGTPQLEF